MESVVRMFTSESGTVRWVTTLVGTEAIEFSVYGPDQWRNVQRFDDPSSLLRFQTEYERFLCQNGYAVSLVNDRRWRGERRAVPRPGEDRRT